ncbi:MAG: shikimate dehydrogenase [Dehalococcoidales bacterium]|nr:shikimate dehydrogenase [Dehalococcoidales bacterium]
MNREIKSDQKGTEIFVGTGTKLCGIIGDPVEHSISPDMQNAAFSRLGLDFVYLAFRVKKEDLERVADSMRVLGIRGINVTMPHKIAVIPFLDEVDDLAAKIGAVNTVVNENGVLKGYNTDASGFLRMLSTADITIENKRVLVLGAGGACRAVACVLAERGAEITIINRSFAPAVELAAWISREAHRKVDVLDLSTGNMESCLKKADILVNTTSVGMSPVSNETLVPEKLLRSGLSVVDIIYNPIRTRLLQEAENKGAKVISGLEMLVQQGAEAFEIWTGEKAPVNEMRRAASGALKANED